MRGRQQDRRQAKKALPLEQKALFSLTSSPAQSQVELEKDWIAIASTIAVSVVVHILRFHDLLPLADPLDGRLQQHASRGVPMSTSGQELFFG
jgi:hypothetical protein